MQHRSLLRHAFIAGLVFLCSSFVHAQEMPVQWEELTGPDFQKAIQKSGGTCLLPLGIIEKHGPHLPLGTDLINVRYVSVKAARQE